MRMRSSGSAVYGVRKASHTRCIGIGLMIATALENNGATVYIVGRRAEVLEAAVKARGVRHTMLLRRYLYLTSLASSGMGT